MEQNSIFSYVKWNNYDCQETIFVLGNQPKTSNFWLPYHSAA